MSHRVWLVCLLLCLSLAGCAFKRSDFVAGPNGQPSEEISDSGKVLGGVLRTGGLGYTTRY